MQQWESCLKNGILSATENHPFWGPYINSMLQNSAPSGLHLAVLVEPYLAYILDGKKTVESRFSMHRIPPYGRVHEDDVILLKKSGGPIVGLCLISDVWYYSLDPESWQEIRSEFTEMLCAQDPDFWSQRKRAGFATLMRIRHVFRIPPVNFIKRDRRGWVVLKPNEK